MRYVSKVPISGPRIIIKGAKMKTTKPASPCCILGLVAQSQTKTIDTRNQRNHINKILGTFDFGLGVIGVELF